MEDDPSDACGLQGDPESEQQEYVLRIDHGACRTQRSDTEVRPRSESAASGRYIDVAGRGAGVRSVLTWRLKERAQMEAMIDAYSKQDSDTLSGGFRIAQGGAK